LDILKTYSSLHKKLKNERTENKKERERKKKREKRNTGGGKTEQTIKVEESKRGRVSKD